MNIFSHHTMFLLCDNQHMSNGKNFLRQIVLHPTMTLISMYKGQSECILSFLGFHDSMQHLQLHGNIL